MSPKPSVERVDGYAPLASYAALGDGRTVALVATDGAIDWAPMPGLHTPPAFAALLDAEHGGRMTMAPTAPFTTTREYLPGTNVLRTTFTTDAGSATVTDALVTGVAGRLPWCELARRIDGVEGEVAFAWTVEPGSVFGDGGVQRLDTVHGPILRVDDVDLVLVGFEHGRLDPDEPGDGRPDGPLDFHGAFTTSAGSRHLIAVCGTQDEPIHVPDPHRVDRGMDRTIRSWQEWSDEFRYEGPWADAVHRSALALKTLIYSPTGAIAAAATTSLPEDLTGGKNWDYRFAWVRDLAYTVAALVRFGLREETHAAVSWVLKALKAQGDEMRIFFELDGSEPDGVHEIDASGWRGIGPVLVGNRAAGQLQLGVYADVLSIMELFVEQGNILDEATSELLVEFANSACRRWPEPDNGIWELEDADHYVSSRMACWTALDTALRLADIGEIKPEPDDVERWQRNRDLLRDWIDEHGWSESRGAYVMTAGGERLDASVLLYADSAFGDPARMDATIDRLRDELGHGPLLYRYSGLEREEGAFVACSFWMAQALAEHGRLEEATVLMDQLVELPNDVGMLAEMISVETGEFLGNLPQALSHLALVNAAFAIQRARGD